MTTARRTRTVLNSFAALFALTAISLVVWGASTPVSRTPRDEARRIPGETAPPTDATPSPVLAEPQRRYQRPVIDPPPPPPPKPAPIAAPVKVQLPRDIRLTGTVYSEEKSTRVALIRVSESAVESRTVGERLTAHPDIRLKGIDRRSVLLEYQGAEFVLEVPVESSSGLIKTLP